MNKKFFQILLFAGLITTLTNEVVVADCKSDCAAARQQCIRGCPNLRRDAEVQGSPGQICEKKCWDDYYTCDAAC
jgi:hypothetical protein